VEFRKKSEYCIEVLWWWTATSKGTYNSAFFVGIQNATIFNPITTFSFERKIVHKTKGEKKQDDRKTEKDVVHGGLFADLLYADSQPKSTEFHPGLEVPPS
jgi:hypothetical protein